MLKINFVKLQIVKAFRLLLDSQRCYRIIIKKYYIFIHFFLTFTKKCTFKLKRWVKVVFRGDICFEEAHFIPSIQKGVSSFQPDSVMS
jgi:hypothetical protein